MELKLAKNSDRNHSSNCTFMELKYSWAARGRGGNEF